MPSHSQTVSRRKCPVTAGFTADGKLKVIYCGMWSCPRCAVKNAKRWAKRARKQLFNGRDGKSTRYFFITLTLGSKIRTVDKGFESIPGLWDRLRKNMQRAYPDSWDYLAFVEGQPDRGGMPHFHVLSSQAPTAKVGKRGWITKHNMHDWAYALGWGFEADLSQVMGDRAASYVAKYASKQHPATPKGFRRVRPSQGWAKDTTPQAIHLIVPRRGESLVDYINRVAYETGLPQEDLIAHWQAVQQLIELERAEL